MGLAVGLAVIHDGYPGRLLVASSSSKLSLVGVDVAALAEPVADAGLGIQLVAVVPALAVPDGAASTKGLTLSPPLALAKSQEKDSFSLCCLIEASWSLEFFGPPDDW